MNTLLWGEHGYYAYLLLDKDITVHYFLGCKKQAAGISNALFHFKPVWEACKCVIVKMTNSFDR